MHCPARIEKPAGARTAAQGMTLRLRRLVAQQRFGRSNEGIEVARYGRQSIRRLVGIAPAWETAPDTTTWFRFRHLLEQHALTRAMFGTIKTPQAASRSAANRR
ncbi:MAG: transposase [Denitromonas halophila]|nr:MAG: transposase [Denitromonas halophila]TVT75017.1 MAG: transposase [Denitromonas halophila]